MNRRGGKGLSQATMEKPPVDLAGMSLKEMEGVLAELGEPAYRARQVMRWVYEKRVLGIDSMTDLSRPLRERLAAVATVGRLTVRREQRSQDGTLKLLAGLADGEAVECVLIPEGKRRTACISSQAGCAMGCTFCATGLGGLARNLQVSEIVGQVLLLSERSEERVTNVVFMGMGEPLANYERVLAAVRLLNDPLGLGIGMRHITISTVGVAPAIRRLAGERLQTVLAVSLHAATDEKRDRIVPLNRRYPIPVLMEACGEYLATTGRRLTFEYALIKDFNDGPDDAARLAELAGSLRCHVNLLPLNPVPETGLARPSALTVDRFAAELRRRSVPATVRKERGVDIDAACGQLRSRAGG